VPRRAASCLRTLVLEPVVGRDRGVVAVQGEAAAEVQAEEVSA
jgi:hypothetical protein